MRDCCSGTGWRYGDCCLGARLRYGDCCLGTGWLYGRLLFGCEVTGPVCGACVRGFCAGLLCGACICTEDPSASLRYARDDNSAALRYARDDNSAALHYARGDHGVLRWLRPFLLRPTSVRRGRFFGCYFFLRGRRLILGRWVGRDSAPILISIFGRGRLRRSNALRCLRARYL